jgi:hypothetical protein
MRKPGQGMPIAQGIKTKSPAKGFTAQSRPNLRVLSDIDIIVEIYKLMVLDLPIWHEGQEDKAHNRKEFSHKSSDVLPPTRATPVYNKVEVMSITDRLYSGFLPPIQTSAGRCCISSGGEEDA